MILREAWCCYIGKVPAKIENSENLRSVHGQHSRIWEGFRWVYPVVSRRAGGLSLGVNLNLDKVCNFDCPYCQVDRTGPTPAQLVDPHAIAEELNAALTNYRLDGLDSHPILGRLPRHQRELRDISISGDGEPTMVPLFAEVCEALAQVQRDNADIPFSLVLITNATLLDRVNVRKGISQLCSMRGEVWAKLDAGTEAWFQTIDRSRIHLDRIHSNIVQTGQEFPLRLQTMLCSIKGQTPDTLEREAWLQRVVEIEAQSAGNLREIQLYSVVRQTSQSEIEAVSIAKLQEWAAAASERVKCPIGVYP